MRGWREIGSAMRWRALLAEAERSALQQSWAYGAAIEAAGHGVVRLAWQAGGTTLALAQLLRRRLPLGLGVVLVLRGPVRFGAVDEPPGHELVEERAMRALAPWAGRAAVVWQPDDGRAAGRRAGMPRVWTGASAVLLDLARPLTELRAGLHGKWRNRLKRAEAAGLRVRAERCGPRLDWLIGETERQRRARGYAAPSPGFTRSLALAGGGEALCLVAEHGGEPVAGMLFIRHGRSATYQMGATTTAGRRLHAHHLLLWTGIERLADAGCATLDLGLADTVTNPGIARFKLGTGGTPLTLAGSYLAPPRFRLPAQAA